METLTRCFQLIIRTGEVVTYLPLTGESIWTLGRGKDSNVQLPDPFLSRVHAKIGTAQGQQFYFIDLKSRNGSLINDQPVTAPVVLKNGDRIVIGQTTIIFEETASILPTPVVTSTLPTRQVFLLQETTAQASLWQEVLSAQGIGVETFSSSIEFKQALESNTLLSAFPDLVMIDVQVCRGNAYYLCRWCSDQFPNLKIVLLDSVRREISALEHQVALRNGALNLFPAINRRNLLLRGAEMLANINEVIGFLDSQPLDPTDFLAVLRRIEPLISDVFGLAVEADPKLTIAA